METKTETKTELKPYNKSGDTLQLISYTVVAAIIIVGGITALLRMSKIMVSDCKEMGI